MCNVHAQLNYLHKLLTEDLTAKSQAEKNVFPSVGDLDLPGSAFLGLEDPDPPILQIWMQIL